jgi:hypothetical protein
MKIFEQNATKVVNLKQLECILKDTLKIHEGNTEDQINSAKRFLKDLGIQGIKSPLTIGDFETVGKSISNGCSENPQVQNVIMGYYMDSVTICNIENNQKGGLI